MNSGLVRLILFIVAFVFILIFPWWISAPILIFFTIFFPLYLEVIPLGFLFDILYSPSFSFPFVGLTLSSILLVVVVFIKSKIRS
jgi:hypothetical protein